MTAHFAGHALPPVAQGRLDNDHSARQIDALLSAIAEPQTRKAAEDLTADWEREGFVAQSRIDQLAVTRKLTVEQLGEVMAVLAQLGVRNDEGPDVDELQAEDSVELTTSPIQPLPGFRNASPSKVLRHEEVVQLSRAIQLGRKAIECAGTLATPERAEIIKRAESARDLLIVSNTGLVYSIAKDYQFIPSLPLEDLVQEGMIGLMRAVDLFDGTRGYRFSTYARWWIRQKIVRALADRGAAVRLPVYRVNEVWKLKKATELLRQEACGEEPTVPELAAALNWSEEKITDVQELGRTSYVSIDAPVREDEETSLGDLLDSGVLSPSEVCESHERQKWVTEAIEELGDRPREIIRRRFGLDSFGDRETLEEIGIDHDLTRERIRQIQEKALKTMRPRAKRWLEKGLTD